MMMKRMQRIADLTFIQDYRRTNEENLPTEPDRVGPEK